VLGDSRDRASVNVSPTREKSLSDCAELADMHSNFGYQGKISLNGGTWEEFTL